MSAVYTSALTNAVEQARALQLEYPSPMPKPATATDSVSILESMAANAPDNAQQPHRPSEDSAVTSGSDSELTDAEEDMEMADELDDDELQESEGVLVGRVIRVADLHLRLVSVLGSGAYGTVYLAFDRITARAYAVKHLPEAHLTPAQRRLQRIEAALHARCTGHPNVLPLYHIVPHYPGVDGWFMVLEYCSEGDLFEYINDGRLGHRTLEREARRLLDEIISAVEWCHHRGVYHRDVKPENVLMRRGSDGRMHAYLGDFGLATEDAWSTEHGCGSTFYMSPESRTSAAPAPYATQPSDVWSVAVLLVNLTCARNPWRRAERHDATFDSFLRNPISTLTQALPITEAFARVLARCFDPNPARRCTLSELRQRMNACPRLRRDLPATDLRVTVPVYTPPAAVPVATVSVSVSVSAERPQPTPSPPMPSLVSSPVPIPAPVNIPAMITDSGASTPAIGSPSVPSTPITEYCHSPISIHWPVTTIAHKSDLKSMNLVPLNHPVKSPAPSDTTTLFNDSRANSNATRTGTPSKSTSSSKSSNRKSRRLSAKSIARMVSGGPGLGNTLKAYRQQILSIFGASRPQRQQRA